MYIAYYHVSKYYTVTLAAIDVSQLCSCIAIIRQVNLYMMLMLLMQLIKIAGNDIIAGVRY